MFKPPLFCRAERSSWVSHTLIAVLACGAVWTTAGAAETASSETYVYHGAGKNRAHLVGCRRLTTDPAELAALTKMTLTEAKAKGLPPCSRCPVSVAEPEGGTATPGAADVVVYHAPGKKRVHVVGCRRLTTDPAELATWTKMTMAEAKAQGLPPCSRCPVSVAEPEDGTATPGAADVVVYHAPGKKRVHVVGCRRLTTDPAELATWTKMTLAEAQAQGLPPCSRCPVSVAEPEGGTASPGASDMVTYHEPGKKRVHVVGCRRLTTDPAELATWTKMTMAEAKAKGLPLCSRCPGSATEPAEPGGSSVGLESWVNPAPEEIKQHTFKPSPLAPLVSMGSDGKLTYRAYSKQGDQLMDWSHCGYRNSSVPIPDVTAAVTLEPLASDAKQVGNLAYPVGSDSRGRIQEAIDTIAAMSPGDDGSRGAVLLRAGTYYVDGPLTVRSGVVLRGEGDGEDGTILIMRSAEGGGTAIHLGEPDGEVEPVGEANAVRITDSYVPSGSLTLTLADTGRFRVGDYIHVSKTVNQAWIDLLGMGERLQHIRGGKEGLSKRPWKPESYRFQHLRRIEAIDGKQITLDAILPQSFDQQHGGGDVFKVEVDALATGSGVEGLRIISNYDTTVKDENKDSNFLNYHSAIMVQGAYDSWVRDCTVKHVSYAAVSIGTHTRQITVRDTNCLEPVGPKRGGKRYAFNIGGGTLHLFYNCYSEDGRHDFAIGSRETGPFAFVNCTAVRGGQSEPHHRWSSGILYDNVVTKDGTLAAINRGDSGSGHGWAAANTLFWNCDAKSIVVMDPETAGENNFAIGFTGSPSTNNDTGGLMYANTRAGYWGTPAEGKFYGHALMGSGHIESPDGPVQPQSLFTQQLTDRIGKDQADAVLR